jgi:SAM-dependent methyltransferase
MPETDIWTDGDRYERYVGRWSRPVADALLAWLGLPPRLRWLDLGSGTGALTEMVLRIAEPGAVTAVDQSAGYLAHARARISDPSVRFEVADAAKLPFPAGSFDVVVSGLVLNFVPDPGATIAEAARVTTAGGTVAAYVWDYAGRMQLIRHFWDAAGELDPRARELDEGVRFPVCQPGPLAALFATALSDVQVREIELPTVFRSFDDYWQPFLGGQGPAPAYLMSLGQSGRDRLRELLRSRLPIAADGSISLFARAWAARGTRAGDGLVG